MVLFFLKVIIIFEYILPLVALISGVIVVSIVVICARMQNKPKSRKE